METLKLLEQDVVNSMCLYIAEKKQVNPHEVKVELMWDEQYGFSAEVEVMGRMQILIEANLIEAIRYWLHHHLKRDPFSAGVSLELDDEEGIISYIKY